MSVKITASDAAPAEAVHYTFAGAEFDLGGSGKKTFSTDDPAVVANALVHPWLTVTYPEVDPAVGAYHDLLDPKDDPLTIAGRLVDPNDPEAVKAAEAAKAEDDSAHVALDAGLTQTTPVVTDGTAETLAADPTSKTSDKAGS